jgi:hypothetical protein
MLVALKILEGSDALAQVSVVQGKDAMLDELLSVQARAAMR